MAEATFELTRAHQGLDRIIPWVTLTIDGTRYPWAGVAVADPVEYEDGYKEARLLLIEDLVLALSDRVTGRMQATKAVFTLSDIPDPITGDTVIRKWLGEHKTLRGATIDIKFLTDAQRRAGGQPRVAFRGRVERYSGPAGFQARFECKGIVGSRLDQPVVDDTIGRHFATAPPETASLPLPLAFGVLSDAGAASPRGYITPVYLGDFPDTETGTVWSVFAYAAHACDVSTIQPEFFTVNNSTGVATQVDPGQYGVTWAAAGRTGYATYWGATPYYTDGLGHRWMIVSVRGPEAFALTTGVTTLRANVLGAEPVGDCSGTVITSIYEQLALLVDNLKFLSETSALGGNWRSSPPTFDDGTEKRDTASFTLAELNAFVTLAGDDGARFVSESTTYGDLIAEVLRSAHARAGVNAAGQFQLVVLNATQPPAADVTEALEILRDSFSWTDDDQLGFDNALPYAYGLTHSAAGAVPALATMEVPLEDTASQTRYQERQEADRLELPWRTIAAQARAVAVLELAESAELPRQVVLASGIHWTMLKLGDIITVTHREGPAGGGWVQRGVVVLGQSISLGSLQVQLTCLDYPGIVTSSSVSASDSASASSSTSPSPSSSVSPSPSPGASASMSPSASVSPSVSRSQSPSSSNSPSVSRSVSPSSSMSPSVSHSPSPSSSSSTSPSQSSSASASESPSPSSSDSPSPSPSESPSPSPSPSDDDPDAFGWTPLEHADADTYYESEGVIPDGYDIPCAVSISTDSPDATFSINGGPFVSSGTISPGEGIVIRMKSGGGDSLVTATVTVGDTSGDWTIEVDIIEG
jgi:hypothetical protein